MRTLKLLSAVLLAAAWFSSAARADVYVVEQVAQSFYPKDITINVGDTVRWTWSSLAHDVTEGDDGMVNGNEAFFGVLSSGNPVFEVTFDQAFLNSWPRPDNRYDYFCSPHWNVNMTGTVTVSDGPGVIFCHCDGNGNWPACGNFGYWGEGCRNSSLEGGDLRSHGSASVAADDLSFEAFDLLDGQPALLFVGNTALSGGNGVAFGDGLRCVGDSVVRLGVSLPSGGGVASWGPGMGALGGWAAGQTRHFQAWYRDPSGSPCGTGFNLTNGLTVDFAG